MIFGVGCDIAKVSRFEKWVLSKDMIEKCGEKYKIHVSLSHEKEYALAFVVIEIIA